MAHGVFRLSKMLDRLDGRVITIQGRKTRATDRRNTEDIAAEVALILLDQHLRRGHR